MKCIILLLVLIVTSLQTGCVVGQRTVSLSVPELGSGDGSKGEVHVGSVMDERGFENKPSNPSTPSIAGDVTQLSAEEKAVMIGRQRNTYRKAMGDIALPKDDSVPERARLLVEQALRNRGYGVTDDESAENFASISIHEFWGWSKPGAWSIAFEARVACTLTLTRGDESAEVTVEGYGINRGQSAKNANWQLAYERAFLDFLANLDAELDKTEF